MSTPRWARGARRVDDGGDVLIVRDREIVDGLGVGEQLVAGSTTAPGGSETIPAATGTTTSETGEVGRDLAQFREKARAITSTFAPESSIKWRSTEI